MVVREGCWLPTAAKFSTHVERTIIEARWVAIGLLLALEAVAPTLRTSSRLLLLVLGAAVLYNLVLFALVMRARDRLSGLAVPTLIVDALLVTLSRYMTDHTPEVLLLAGAVVVEGALRFSYRGSVAVAAVVSLGEILAPPLLSDNPARVLAVPVRIGFLFLIALAAGWVASREHEQRARFTMLREKALVSESPADLTTLTRSYLDTIASAVSADSGSIMVAHGESRDLEIMASRGLDVSRIGSTTQRIGQGVAGWVAQEGKGLLLSRSPGQNGPFPLLREDIVSAISIPVRVRGHTYGVINLNRSQGHPPFDEQDYALVSLVASQLGAALVQVQHLQAVAERVRHLAALHNIVVTSRNLDVATLHLRLLEETLQAVGSRRGILARVSETGQHEVVAVTGFANSEATELLKAALESGNDHRARQIVPPAPPAGETGGVVAIPLTTAGRSVGLLCMDADLAGIRGDEGMALLEATARHLAVAVDSAHTMHHSVETGVTEERRRIAREIHDGLAQRLADALLQTELTHMAVRGDNPQQAFQDLADLRTLIEQGIRELRSFMTSLREPVMADGGLFTSLRHLIHEFQRRSSIEVESTFSDQEDLLSPAAKLTILSVVQEALVNVRKHAQATRVAISIENNATAFRCSVTDNGRGFDVASQAESASGQHLGLTSMRERAGLVRGTLDVRSAPGLGTSITLTIPIIQEGAGPSGTPNVESAVDG
ncbi:MAG: GAF domain-containing sensor histidine kinase [Armatimonadetes bacterium]|nr:GAF domain-containing sensor histidine kinase [Armatimonadota bacterium]